MVARALIGGRVESAPDTRTLGELIVQGGGTELDYLGAGACDAIDLELDLTLDAVAGVDLRARLVGRACSA